MALREYQALPIAEPISDLMKICPAEEGGRSSGKTDVPRKGLVRP